MCELIIVDYKCGHQERKGIMSCVQDPRLKDLEGKDVLAKFLAMKGRSMWYGCDGEGAAYIGSKRLCSSCRNAKREEMRNIKKSSEDWGKRYNWSWWNTWVPKGASKGQQTDKILATGWHDPVGPDHRDWERLNANEAKWREQREQTNLWMP